MTRRFEYASATDPDGAAAIMPGGWRPRLYRLDAGRLHLTRKYLELSPGLSIEELRLVAGGVRVDGALDPGVLKIGFFETQEMRVLGHRVSNAVLGVAYGGARFDSVNAAPGMALTLNFSPSLARRVVPDHALPRLLARLCGPNGLATLLYPVTPKAFALRQEARRLLALGESGAASAAWPHDAPDAMVAACADLIEQILGSALRIPQMTAGRRRDLALAVERLLWERPAGGGFRKFSLDDASLRLRASRRSVQLALQEEFGMGFVALKRAIRLQQVHAILKSDARGGIGEIARAYEFFHQSRFSKHYREMFGVLPSMGSNEAPTGG
ncbi:helix-turn-helix domain-containing protein [Methylocystis sp. JAN1]|uniref:helix-turn-helix transcriptional regulator n=1 Tax=Methylocystis sp. JAN1 TaxID=3397211 RepID=UPI003FA2F45F